MRIEYSKHARKRMRERNVTDRDVRRVFHERGAAHPSPKKRTLRGRTLGGAPLEVVYTEEHRQEFRIVTVKLPSR